MPNPTDKQIAQLHCHSTFSVLDGVSTIDDYVKWTKDNNSPGVAITDHGWCIGALEVYDKAKKAGVIGIPGCEFYLIPHSDYQFAGKAYDYYHVTVWAINEKGYRNLLKLGSLAFGEDLVLSTKAVKEDGIFKNKTEEFSRVVKKFGDVKPRITFDELLTYNEGIVLGSGCLIGALSKSLLSGEKEGAERNLSRLLEVYRNRMFMEVMAHKCTHNYDRKLKTFIHNECTEFSPDGDIQKSVNLAIIDLAQKYKLPIIMSVDSHFIKPSEKKLQDALLQQGDPDGWTFHESYHVQDTTEAWQNWQALYGNNIDQRKIFAEAVENTHQVVDMARGLSIKDSYKLPHIDIPESISINSTSEAESLKLLIFQKIEEHGRMKWDDPVYADRLQMEIDVICDNGVQDFAKYFLFMEKWLQWARDNSVLTGVGRGSAAGSLLSFLLKITHLDPIKTNLPFERFLSSGRIKRAKFPDIDCDFATRDIIMAKLFETYGDKAAQCSTHGKIKVRSAIKDVHRFLVIRKLEKDLDALPRGEHTEDIRLKILKEMDNERFEVNALTRSIDMTPTGVDDKDFLLGYTDKEGNYHVGHLEKNIILQEYFKKHSSFDKSHDMQSLVESMLGIPKSVGRHASSALISDRPISESVPTCVINGVLCTQYTANGNSYVEKAGLIKFDILTVNALQDVSVCIRLIQKSREYKTWKENYTINKQNFIVSKGELTIEQIPSPFDGSILNIYNLPEKQEVFDMITKGDTSSIFQASTPLMTQWASLLKPTSISDLSGLVSVVRPGPLEALVEDGKTTMSMAFVLRKNGKMPITYIHPDMEPALKNEYGNAIYQENLAQMFVDILGYSSEEADYIRELIGKKKSQDMEKLLPELRKRLTDKGWNPEQTQLFIDMCISAAKYSFNRSHGYSYGYTAYMTAFLKHYFPVEWWTAVLQNCKVEEIREKGYAKAIAHLLVTPHINGPMEYFEARPDGKVHTPLWLIDGVAEAACSAIQNSRDKLGRDFNSLQEFFELIDKRAVNEGTFKRLILVGAFSLIELNRRPESLYEEYAYLKHVSKIKSHSKKTGTELKEAVVTYKKEKGINQDINQVVAEMTKTDLEIESERIRLLPIYRLDVHESFKSLLQNKISYSRPDPDDKEIFGTFSYGEQQTRGGYVIRDRECVPISNTQSGLEIFYEFADNKDKVNAAWAGLIEDISEFKYIDKKTNKEVAALKIQIVNNGDSVECILWPKTRQQMALKKEKEPTNGKIVICAGQLKHSRTPGKMTISANFMTEIC